jgi:hypothetical protein
MFSASGVAGDLESAWAFHRNWLDGSYIPNSIMQCELNEQIRLLSIEQNAMMIRQETQVQVSTEKQQT